MNLTISADLKACDIFKMIEEQNVIFWYAHKEKVFYMFRRVMLLHRHYFAANLRPAMLP